VNVHPRLADQGHSRIGHTGASCGRPTRSSASRTQAAQPGRRIFPNEAVLIRLVGEMLVDIHDEWSSAERRHVSEWFMAKLYAQRDKDDATVGELARHWVGDTSAVTFPPD
jgi:hypothetical protein